jgi:hypothetical protein
MTAELLSKVSFDVRALHAAYRGGLSPGAVTVEAYRRPEAAQNPAIFIWLRPLSDVQAEAASLPPFNSVKMPLWGLPIAGKDNSGVAGLSTTAAHPSFAYTPEKDAFAVAMIRAVGPVPVRKSNLDQFATGLVGVRLPAGHRSALPQRLRRESFRFRLVRIRRVLAEYRPRSTTSSGLSRRLDPFPRPAWFRLAGPSTPFRSLR